MNDDQALIAAQEALKAWGVEMSPRLIKNRENIVLEAASPDGQRAALRLHRPGYQSDDAIRSELWWSEALVAAGMIVPQPIRTLAGEVLATGGPRVASLVTWLEGAPLGEGGVQLAMAPQAQADLHEALGAELARLHLASDAMERPEAFEREVLDLDALLGEDPSWGRFWENASLSEEEAHLLLTCRDKLRAVIGAHAAADGDFGLIHADALRENVLVQGDDVRLIDFDDGVFGFRMYELGVAMSQNWDQANEADLGGALLRGYASVRALPENAAALLDAFTVMRAMASCGWVIGRYADDHPAVRDYAERAIAMAKRFV
ncbi:phosphotransferase enzyme family protein [Shimia marina]|uniref:Homoserine kinase n=1 Tax=Shimia marina TaxID=321267 RepID=A0A0P1FAE4_9RHOB|nr:phosphotransferase [Shimia marina]CUH51630.1 Homoserine kinase [Shimia marina]SFD44270.1 Ser/Thr protein kinase RdoA involved in Cpx stress response, MazF antagonist [Shimia marina]